MNKLRTSSRYFINAMLAAVLLSSCGYDALEVKNNVQTKFYKAKEIIRPAGKDYTYIVIDSSVVYGGLKVQAHITRLSIKLSCYQMAANVEGLAVLRELKNVKLGTEAQ